MRGIVKVVTAAAILAASVSVGYGANDTLKCDKEKSAAVVKLFKDAIRCNHKAQFDLSFDLTECRGDAYDKCTAKISKADLKYGAACFNTANFNVCTDALNAANSIYPNI